MTKKIGHNIILLFKKPITVFKRLICRIRSLYYSVYIDEGNGKIIVTDPGLSIKIVKAAGAKLIINGAFRITPHVGGNSPVRIFLGNNSILKIDGDFLIGQGVRILINHNAELSFGGKKLESDSGITADTLIMVFRKVTVGSDFICAWNVFISDSDWHQIGGKPHNMDVKIGDHVWIANNCSVLKGSNIGNNSIVASHSKVINKEYPANSLLAGTPVKIIDSDITWSRDFKTI